MKERKKETTNDKQGKKEKKRREKRLLLSSLLLIIAGWKEKSALPKVEPAVLLKRTWDERSPPFPPVAIETQEVLHLTSIHGVLVYYTVNAGVVALIEVQFQSDT